MPSYTPAVDLHAHFMCPAYLALLKKYGIEKPDDYPIPFWSEQEQLDSMEELGIQFALIGTGSPHVSVGSPEDAVRCARQINLAGAELAAKYPDKLALAGTLPLPDAEKSLEEVRFCIGELGVKGFCWPSHARGVYLGDPALDPILAEIDGHGLPIVMHPTTPAAVPAGSCPRLPIPVIEFFFDSTRVMMNLFLNRTLHKFPNIKFIIPHAGACMPLITERVQGVVDLPDTPFPEVDVLGDLKRLYFDVMGVCEDKRLKALLEVADEDHILYGSDNPHAPIHVRHRSRAYLEQTPLLSDALRRKLLSENARRILEL